MNKNWMNTYKAFIYKEVLEVKNSMILFIVMTIVAVNTLQYVTVMQIFDVYGQNENMPELVGSSVIYLVIIVNLFLGNTLISRFVYQEKNNKTAQTMIAYGMSKTSMWAAKMTTVIIICEITSILSILIHYIVVWMFWDICVAFSASSAIILLMAMPILLYGILALISVAYSFFTNLKIFEFILPLVILFGVWNLALRLLAIEIPIFIMMAFSLIGIILICISALLIKNIPNEKYVRKGE
jgi:hypothetical protein